MYHLRTDGTLVNGIILFPDEGYAGPTSNDKASVL